GGLRLHGAREVALSRTSARTLVPEQPSIREIAGLYRDAIASAERSIYIENQYFSSKAVLDALLARLRDPGRPRLNVAIVCPRQLKSFTESLSMGPLQSAMIRRLRATARETGHALEVFAAGTPTADGPVDRYVHSKVLIVDDRLLSIGSANTNNRSMGLDTELNATWEAVPGDETLERAIRKVRLSLVAEHAGARSRRELRALADPDGMTEALVRAARDPQRGLRLHPADGADDTAAGLDPDRPVVEEDLFEPLAPSRRDMMRAGVRRIRWRFRRPGRREHSAVNSPITVAGAPPAAWILIVQSLRRLVAPAIAFAILFGLSMALYGLLKLLF
ncbi:MAG TPA: phospholipase D-like domain-containing protein, partial [Planctomycetota bacterium]|nr:phospholipase D-like domain-containing protein [Planctomycetota bacterium]